METVGGKRDKVISNEKLCLEPSAARYCPAAQLRQAGSTHIKIRVNLQSGNARAQLGREKKHGPLPAYVVPKKVTWALLGKKTAKGISHSK